MHGSDEAAIATSGLSKSYGDVQALRSLDLSVPRHSIFGFLGPNGAGKTTLVKLLLGLCRPLSGGARIFGLDIARDSVRVRERIGYLPQQLRFVEYMSARENLLFAARFFFSGPRARLQERCEEMLQLVGLAGKADRPIKGFSGGEKQRLGIALAQVNYPDLLILDEPASALDPLGRQRAGRPAQAAPVRHTLAAGQGRLTGGRRPASAGRACVAATHLDSHLVGRVRGRGARSL